MTGLWHDRGVWAAARYAVDLLFGLRGFAWYNLPILLGVVGLPSLRRCRPEIRTLLAMHLGFSAVVVLAVVGYLLAAAIFRAGLRT
jgi:hypothetical protein